MKILQFILAITMLSFMSCQDISEKMNSDGTDSETTTENQEPDVYAEDVDFDEETTEETGLEETEITNESEDNSDKEVVESGEKKEKANEPLKSGEFYIIAGSFKDINKAQNLYKLLSKRGYSDAKILNETKDGFNRVVVGAYTNETKARGDLGKMRKVLKDDSVWLLIVE